MEKKRQTKGGEQLKEQRKIMLKEIVTLSRKSTWSPFSFTSLLMLFCLGLNLCRFLFLDRRLYYPSLWLTHIALAEWQKKPLRMPRSPSAQVKLGNTPGRGETKGRHDHTLKVRDGCHRALLGLPAFQQVAQSSHRALCGGRGIFHRDERNCI